MIKPRFIFIFFFIFSASRIGAQPSDSITFISKQEFTAEHPTLYNSFFRNQPAIYFSNSTITLQKPNARLIYADIPSISALYEVDSAFLTVEYIYFVVNNVAEATFQLDINQMVLFPNLSHIIFSYTFDICGNKRDNCIKNRLQNQIHGNKSLTVIYQLSLPE